jgi:actin-related protein 6
MMEETFLVNIVKEKMCYVSLDFINDMHETKCAYRSFLSTANAHSPNARSDDVIIVTIAGGDRQPNNRIVQKYLLPDYTTTDRGHILSEDEANQRQAARKAEGRQSTNTSDTDAALDEQVLVMNNERIAIPEILFHPSDIGVPQVR